jgi:hypothetical protein
MNRVTSTPPPSRELHGGLIGPGIGCISLALMSTEIMLTRIFSVVLWYHFAFFAISVALLGLGAGAVLVHALQDRLDADRTCDHLSRGALLLGTGILALDATLLRVAPDWFGSGMAVFFTALTWKLLAIFALTSAPFLGGGFVVSLALVRYRDAIHRLYAWDLAGAGAACALVVPLLDHFGGPHALVAAIGFSALAALAFAAHEPQARGRRLTITAVLACGMVALAIGAAASSVLDIRMAKGLDLEKNKPEWNRWNSFSLVSVFPFWNFQGWGLSPAYRGPVAAQKGLVIDMNAFTALTHFDGDFEAVAYTRHDLSAFVFRAQPAPTNVCIIGAGGGKDVLAALAAGSRRVTGVEVNPLIVDHVMRGRYRAFTGGLYDRKDVDIHVEDGRSFVRRSGRRYDVILISMVDTSAATAAGAFALAENTLYTSDAFHDFFEGLTQHGILTVASVSLEGLAVGARLAALARAALIQRGADPARSVAVLRTRWLAVDGANMYNLLIEPAGFDAGQVREIERAADELRFEPVYLPSRQSRARDREAGWIARILGASNDAALAREMSTWPLDVSSIDDDRPYFFYQNRLGDAWHALFARSATHLYGNGLIVLVKVLVAAVAMLALLIALPLWLSGPTLRRGGSALSWDLGYVACVGLGFMFLEIAFVQRLVLYLGNPTYTLTAVLFSLLVGGGIGSRASQRLGRNAVRSVFVALLLYASGVALGWVAIANATLAWSPTARAVAAALSLLPLGALLGVPLPSALSVIGRRDQGRIPWLWGVNSATSVLGSILATLVSMHLGVTSSLLLGIAFYAAAMLAWQRITV